MDIPSKFKTKIIGCFGDVGEAWLKRLPTLVEHFIKDWQLTLISPVENLSYNYVLKVLDEKGDPAILKLGVPNFDFQNEIRTMEAYNGRGCAKMLKADPIQGGILQEQLTPGIMLSDIKDEEEVIHHYIKVWKAIRHPLPNGAITPTIMDWATSFDRYKLVYPNEDGPIQAELLTLANRLFKEITETSSGIELLHGDLHHENILYSSHYGWLAIDPKGVAGDPYFDFGSFLINQLHNKDNPKEILKLRVNQICEGLSLDRGRFLEAAIAMTILYTCWGIEDSDPEWENTYECVQWLQEF